MQVPIYCCYSVATSCIDEVEPEQVEYRKRRGSPSHRSVRIFVASGARDASSPRMASPLGVETHKREKHPVLKPLQRFLEKIQKVSKSKVM